MTSCGETRRPHLGQAVKAMIKSEAVTACSLDDTAEVGASTLASPATPHPSHSLTKASEIPAWAVRKKNRAVALQTVKMIKNKA